MLVSEAHTTASGRRRNPSGELLEDELAHSPGIGLSAHLLHHRADERARGRDLAVADLVGDVRVVGDRLVDGRAQGPVVGDDGQAAGLDDLLGRALAGVQALEDLAGQLVVDAARVDEPLDGGEGTPEQIVEARGLAIVSDDGALGAAVDKAIADNPDVADKIRDGKVAAAGALIGSVMKEMRGQADAGRVRELILEKLS